MASGGPSGGPPSPEEMEMIMEFDAFQDKWFHKENACAITFIVLGSLFVLLRFVTRQFNDKSRFGLDDYMIIPGLMTLICLCVSLLVFKHYNDVLAYTESQTAAMDAQLSILKVSYVISVVYPLACMFPKLSIALTYYQRIFTSTTFNKAARAISLGLVVFLTANGIAFFIPSAYPCHPLSQVFGLNPPDPSKCINMNAFGTFISLPHIVTDVLMLALPLPLVWRLQFGVAKKLGLTLIFLSGALGLVGSCVRFGLYIKLNYVLHTSQDDASGPDFLTTKLNVLAYIATVCEVGMYLISSCLPPILGLVSQKGPGWVSSTSSYIFRSSGTGGSNDESKARLGSRDEPKAYVLSNKNFSKLNVSVSTVSSASGEKLGV